MPTQVHPRRARLNRPAARISATTLVVVIVALCGMILLASAKRPDGDVAGMSVDMMSP